MQQSGEDKRVEMPHGDVMATYTADQARGYIEYCLGQECETFADFYGRDALIEQLAHEGERLGFTVEPREASDGQ
ncbi:MAG: hypothetical protein AAFY06_00085 [Pseudomonadota bacterium]